MDQQKQQEMLMQASFLKQEADEIDQKLEFVNNQIEEMEQFQIQLTSLDKSQDEFLSNLGRGVFLKTKPLDKKLFVNVGQGIFVKKTPKETSGVLDSQIKQFKDAKTHLMGQREIIHHNLLEMIKEVQGMKKEK